MSCQRFIFSPADSDPRRDRLFPAEGCPLVDDPHVDDAVELLPLTIERADQYPAIPAQQELRQAAALAIVAGMLRVADPNQQRTLRVGDVGRAVLAAEVAVAGARLVTVRGTCEFQLDTNVTAVA